MPMMWWIVPARKGSKEVPGKNRVLVPRLLKEMRHRLPHTILTTDDEVLLTKFKSVVGVALQRPQELCTDTASMRSVLRHTVRWMSLDPNAVIAVMYPSFPAPDFNAISCGIQRVEFDGAPIALGRMPVLEHPYRMFVSGDPLTNTGTYRRQEYPHAWSICHAVCVMRVRTLDIVDDNLYHPGADWVDIPRQLDVDTQEDMAKLKRKS